MHQSHRHGGHTGAYRGPLGRPPLPPAPVRPLAHSVAVAMGPEKWWGRRGETRLGPPPASQYSVTVAKGLARPGLDTPYCNITMAVKPVEMKLGLFPAPPQDGVTMAIGSSETRPGLPNAM